MPLSGDCLSDPLVYIVAVDVKEDDAVQTVGGLEYNFQALVATVLTLLDAASHALNQDPSVARVSIGRASSLLRAQFDHGRRDVSASDSENGGLLAWQSRCVTEYIDQHLASKIRVADLSGLLGRSAAHFSRAFKLTFAETPHAYVLKRRVERARHLMLVSDESLSEIALNCGLTDQAHLCNAFRESFGQSPGAWRRARIGRPANGRPAIPHRTENRLAPGP